MHFAGKFFSSVEKGKAAITNEYATLVNNLYKFTASVKQLLDLRESLFKIAGDLTGHIGNLSIPQPSFVMFADPKAGLRKKLLGNVKNLAKYTDLLYEKIEEVAGIVAPVFDSVAREIYRSQCNKARTPSPAKRYFCDDLEKALPREQNEVLQPWIPSEDRDGLEQFGSLPLIMETIDLIARQADRAASPFGPSLLIRETADLIPRQADRAPSP